jgi:hypothetical protein
VRRGNRFFFEKKVTARDLPPPLWALWGRAGVGAVPRSKADREAGKHFFFEKKQQKTFDEFGFGSPGETEAEVAKFFRSFIPKSLPA